jgi:hypothetical protein
MKANGHASLDGLLDALAQRVGDRTAPRDGDTVADLSHKLDRLTSMVERLVEAIEAKAAACVEPLLLDRRAAASALSISPSMLDMLRRDGKLAAVVVGTKPMFSAADLRAFVEKHRERPSHGAAATD